MALSLRGSAENSATNGGAVTTTLPGGTAEGDVVIAAFGIGSNEAIDFNMSLTTASYTELADLYRSAAANLGVFRKIMGASPDSTVVSPSTTTLGNADTGASCVLVAHVWTGADQTTPEDATTTTATGLGGTALDPAAITTVTDNAVVLAIGMAGEADTTVTAPTGYINLIDDSESDSIGTTVAIASKAKTPAGSENPGAWGITAPDESWCAATVAIRPAAGAAFTDAMLMMF